MNVKVRLSDIIDAMEAQSEFNKPYLNVESGEMIYVSESSIRDAINGKPPSIIIESQREEVELANSIIENEDKYLAPPSSFEIHEYSIMEDFCYSLNDSEEMDILVSAIRGSGAFRRFKDTLFELDLENDWYLYRDKRYREIAIEFCERFNIDYTE